MKTGRPLGATTLEVRAIRQEYLNGARYVDLTRRHGLSHGTIGRIVRGEHPLASAENLSRGVGRYRRGQARES